jgi:hypothetical protein
MNQLEAALRAEDDPEDVLKVVTPSGERWLREGE